MKHLLLLMVYFWALFKEDINLHVQAFPLFNKFLVLYKKTILHNFDEGQASIKTRKHIYIHHNIPILPRYNVGQIYNP